MDPLQSRTEADGQAVLSFPIRLLVVDDHPLFRRGLVALLSQDERFQIVGEAGDAGEALRQVERHPADVMLLDNHMPGVRGVDAIASIKTLAPDLRIMMLTVSEDENDLCRALRAGADGYLIKTMQSEALIDSLLRVMQGDSVVSPEMLGKLVAALRQPSASGAAADSSGAGSPEALAPQASSARTLGVSDLSPRETEILRCIARGASNKVIARELHIAETTVKIHVQHILRKLNLSSRVQVAVLATEQGWV